MSRPRPAVVRPQRLAFAIAALLPFGTAFAQDAATTTAEKEAATLDTVEVTAQRKVENIQDVPVSISSVSAEKLDVLGSGGNDVRFLSGRVPSLNIESSYGRAFPRFYIRGLGNTDFDLNASQPVSLVYDEVVQESPLLKGFPIFDLERIEVLRGPQGTLFGRNTPAGVVKFESAKPTRELDGYAQLSYGTDNMWNFEGAIGGPLSERWSARVSALYQRKEDWVKNQNPAGPDRGAEGYDESAARVQFLYEGDAFEGLFNLHKRHLNGTAILYGDRVTGSMQRAISETERRRTKQIKFNEENRVVPKGVTKRIKDIIDGVYDATTAQREHKAAQQAASYEAMSEKALTREIKRLEKEMADHARNLEFEKAAAARDELFKLKEQLFGVAKHDLDD